MAASNEMEVKIGADVQGAVTGINTLNKSLASLPKGANQATTSLTNFSRVVQDAPFGIIGVANNIDPLITSFQNLSKTTGGAGGAFKALGAALAGPAGVAIAVSTVTSALIAFGPEISNALTGVSKFDAALKDSLVGGAEAAKKAQLEFAKYASVINDSNVSAARQKDALDKVNASLDDYGLKVKSVADFQKNSAQISALYVLLKQEEAKAQVLAAKAAEEYGKQIAAQFTIQKAQGVLADNRNQSALGNAIRDLIAAFQEYNSNKTLGTAIQLENAFNDQLKQSNINIASLIEQLKNVSGVTEDFGKKTVNNTKRVFEYKNAINALKSALIDFQVLDLEKIATAQEKIFNPDPAIKLAKKQKEAINIQKADRTSTLVLTEEAIKKQAEYSALIDAQNERYQQQLATINAISGVLNTGIDQFFNAIANNQDPFKALAQSAQRLVVELAAAVLKALALQAVTAAFSGGASLGVGGLAGAAGGGGGGLLDLILRGDLLSGAVGRSSTRRRGF